MGIQLTNWMGQHADMMDEISPQSTIRPAAHRDSNTVVKLWKRLVTEIDVAAGYPDLHAAVDKWSDRLGRQIDEEKAFVAELDGKIVGFACYVGRTAGSGLQNRRTDRLKGPGLPIPLGVAYVTDLYVTPAARHQGLAQGLLGVIMRGAESTGFHTVWTNTSSRNKRTLSLLSKLGFAPLQGFQIPDLDNQVYYARAL